MTDQRVSVLVVNWNTKDHLARCLRSLRDAEEVDDLEIIVVDNGSIDGSAEMVRREFPNVALVANQQNTGFTAATNQAYEVATGDVLLMLNSDTIVPSGSIRRCRAYLATNERVGALGCRLLNADGSEQSSCFRFPTLFTIACKALWLANAFPTSPILNRERYGNRHWDGPTPVEVVMGSFLMVRRAAVRSRTLLDNGYWMYAEETDLCRRLKRDGWSVVFYPDIAITHLHEASTKTPRQRAWAEEAKRRGTLRFLALWQGTVTAYLANLIMLIGLLPRIIIWAMQDLRASMRARSFVLHEIRRARAAMFHLAALADPGALEQTGGPPT